MFEANHKFISIMEDLSGLNLQISKANALKKDIADYINLYISTLTDSTSSFSQVSSILNNYFLFSHKSSIHTNVAFVKDSFYIDHRENISSIAQKYSSKNSFFDRNRDNVFMLYLIDKIEEHKNSLNIPKRYSIDTFLNSFYLSSNLTKHSNKSVNLRTFYNKINLDDFIHFLSNSSEIITILTSSYNGDLEHSYYLNKEDYNTYVFGTFLNPEFLVRGTYSEVAYFVLSNKDNLPCYVPGSLSSLKVKADIPHQNPDLISSSSLSNEFINSLISRLHS